MLFKPLFKPGVVAHACNPVPKRLGQEDQNSRLPLPI